MASEKKTYTLQHPIKFGSETITSLEFRAPKGKDMRRLTVTAEGGVSMDDMLELAAALCGQPPSVIDDLEGVDIFGVLDIVGAFMPRGRTTGRKR